MVKPSLRATPSPPFRFTDVDDTLVKAKKSQSQYHRTVQSTDSEPNPETWREIHFVAVDPTDADLDVKLLRPLTWIERMNARAGEILWIEIDELNFAGLLRVVRVLPCPPPGPGDGAIVTGKFKHIAPETLHVSVEGLDQPIRCTPQHPFWSVTRQEFIPAAKLLIGEELDSSRGCTVRVTGLRRDLTPQPVYNIEVHGHHVYRVSPLGLLVHNASRYQEIPERLSRTTPGDELISDAIADAGLSFSIVRRHPQHHVFPQAHRNWFKRRGVDIDAFAVNMFSGEHAALHGGGNWLLGQGWNREWNHEIMRRLRVTEKAQRSLGGASRLSTHQIEAIGREMMADYGIADLPFVKYQKGWLPQ